MSTAHVPQNAADTGDNESNEDEITIRTRLFYPLFGIAVIIGVILDVIILMLLNTYVPGRARTPFWIFIIPVAILVFLVSFVDDVLAKRCPHLVPEELRRQRAAAEASKAAGASQQQGYAQMPGNPVQGQVAPQYQGGQVPQQAQYGQPQQPGQVPPSGQYGHATVQAPQNQQPHSQSGQPGQTGPVGY